MCWRGKKDICYQSFRVVPWCTTDAAWHRCTLRFQTRVEQHEKDSVIALNVAEITREGEGKWGIQYTTRRPFWRHWGDLIKISAHVSQQASCFKQNKSPSPSDMRNPRLNLFSRRWPSERLALLWSSRTCRVLCRRQLELILRLT